ncbi:MAG: tetratricopeptide repeat protein [Treponema sp.]|jgi:tetratricopeptide (TPR) repeat protein|nr:tetratricopeptide repeat protein [Treponema sp.]
MNTSSPGTIHCVLKKVFPVVIMAAVFVLSCTTGAPPVDMPPDRAPAETAKPERPAAEPAGTQDILARIAVLLGREDYTAALALFDRIDPADAKTADIQLLKASALGSAGRTGEARTIVTAIFSQEPDNMDALYVLSVLEGREGKDREQKKILEQIIQTDPKHVAALVDLGNLAFGGTRSLTAAAGYFDRALKEDPGNRDAMVGRAQVYRYSRDPKNAERLLNRAVRLYPQWAGPLHERARLYRGAGYPVQALEDIDKAKTLEPDNYWIAVDRGSILLDLNRKQEALEEFSRAVTLSPGSFIAYVYTAGIKDEFGDYEEAEKDYGALIKLRPEYYFAFEGLGVLKMRKHLWAEARDHFLEAYRQAPKESNYALLAAMNWMRAGRQNDPRQFLETAIRRVERESLDWYLLRLYHDLAGDNDIVVRLDREKNLDIKARTLYYLASYYDIRGNKNLADKYFLQVKDLDRRAIPEWRLNELALEERNLKAF